VRVIRQPKGARSKLRDGVVEDVVGPTDGGAGWAVAIRVGDALWVLPEDDLESITPRADPAPERIDVLQLRLASELTDGVEAARVAERIDEELRAVVGPAILSIEAERHWAEPYFYELDVTVRPLGDPLNAFRALPTPAATAGSRAATTVGAATSGGTPTKTRPGSSCRRCAARRSACCRGARRRAALRASGRSSASEAPPAAPTLECLAYRRRRAMKKPAVPWRCGTVRRNSGRVGCLYSGCTAPRSSGWRPEASTTASFSSAFSVQTE
jgi:hypothetical protein